MLSLQIKPIMNAKLSANYYFSKDNYYFSGELSTSWYGVGAQRLGMGNEVKVDQLEALLAGTLPNGEVIGLKSQSGEIKHRGGYDLTFSAPKSLSYLGLVCGHNEFVELHQKAVTKVLSIIEKEGAQARKMGKEGVEFEKTDNLCFAQILHDTSRALDPQLHTHALLMNMTERADGKWRSLASDIQRKNGTMEWIMANQIYLGLIYRSELALGLKELGLEIEQTGDAHGLFEIKYFNKDLLSNISKRRIEIESQIKGMNSVSLKAYDRATLQTRKAKETVDPEALRLQWRDESKELGIDPSTYWNTLKQNTSQKASPIEGTNKTHQEGVLDAISHLESVKISFSYQELLKSCLYFSLGEKGVDGLIKGIDEEIKKGTLIPLDCENKLFTTQALIAKEKKLLTLVSTFPKQSLAIEKNPDKASDITSNLSIQKTIMQALSTKEGIVRIRQESSVSRETLKAMIDYAEGDKRIKVLSPSRFSASSIITETQRKPQSLWQWLISSGKEDLAQTISGFNRQFEKDNYLPFFNNRKEKELLIVDDVQRLTPDELNQFISIAEQRHAKVILLEKPEALTGFQSDIPGLLDKAAVKTMFVQDKPQKNVDVSLLEVKEKEHRFDAIAKLYIELPIEEREQVKILTQSKSEVLVINERVREQLKLKGELGLDEKVFTTLSRISLSESEKKLAKSYQPGWVLFQQLKHETRKLKVLTVNAQENCLKVQDNSGLVTQIAARKLAETINAFEEIPLAVAAGDRLVATADMKSHGIKLGSVFSVDSLTAYGLKLKLGNKTIRLPANTMESVAFMHDYAKGIYSHDFKACDKTLITLPSYGLSKNILSSLSESSNKLTIITDDSDKAKRYLQKLRVNDSAISTTLKAAAMEHQIQPINRDTVESLLLSLNKAIDFLSQEKPVKSDAEKALQFAITHLSEREAVFSKTQVLEVAIQKALGVVGIDNLASTLNQYMDDGLLQASNNHWLTTNEAIACEKNIISTVIAGQKMVNPLITPMEAEEKLKHTNLTQGQKEACELIATTNDRFVMIQGYAGTGKTTMTRTVINAIKQVKDMANGDIDIIAVAPTHQAVKEMKDLGVKAQTLKSFLIENQQHPMLSQNCLILLDESSMVSNRDSERLIKLIHEMGARGVLLGDIAQHQSIESGKPSALLMKTGSIQVAWMSDIVRQQVVPYRQAIETLVKGDTNSALNQLSILPLPDIGRQGRDIFNQIKSSIVEVKLDEQGKDHSNKQMIITPSKDGITTILNETPVKMAVGDYLSRIKECRDQTIVVIHENKAREIANQDIRNGLIKEGSLGSENKLFSRLMSTNYTTAELYHPETYANILRQKETHYLKKNNQYFKIMELNSQSGVVSLMDERGDKSFFIPEKEYRDWSIELFKQIPGELSVGEKIHFKKSDKDLNRFANDRLEVISVTESSFVVKDAEGNKQNLEKNKLADSHWDYSYTSTSYSIQGSSATYVIGVADTQNPKTNHFRSFYIMVSRGSLHAMLYTDNFERLKQQLRITPEKTSALEALGLVKNKTGEITKVQQSHNPINFKANADTHKLTYDVENIVQNLSMNAERVIESLLGEPNQSLSSNSEYRYGSKGSLSFCLYGEKRGTWFNFETGAKGNLIHLIQDTLNLNFKQSLDYAAKLTGTNGIVDTMKNSINMAGIYEPNSQLKIDFNKISESLKTQRIKIDRNEKGVAKMGGIEQDKYLGRLEREI